MVSGLKDCKFEMTLRNQIQFLESVILGVVVAIISIIFVVYKFGIEHLPFTIGLGMVIYSIIILPAAYVFIQYRGKNKGDKLCINYQNEMLEYEHNSEKITFKFEDIELIEQYKTPSVIEKRLPWLPFDSYNYSKIKLKNGHVIYITCLLVNEFILPVEPERILLYRVFFPSIVDSHR